MKLNDLTCPTCNLRCLVEGSDTTCDGCGNHFTAEQSVGVKAPLPTECPFKASEPIVWPSTTTPLINPSQWGGATGGFGTSLGTFS